MIAPQPEHHGLHRRRRGRPLDVGHGRVIRSDVGRLIINQAPHTQPPAQRDEVVQREQRLPRDLLRLLDHLLVIVGGDTIQHRGDGLRRAQLAAVQDELAPVLEQQPEDGVRVDAAVFINRQVPQPEQQIVEGLGGLDPALPGRVRRRRRVARRRVPVERGAGRALHRGFWNEPPLLVVRRERRPVVPQQVHAVEEEAPRRGGRRRLEQEPRGPHAVAHLRDRVIVNTGEGREQQAPPRRRRVPSYVVVEVVRRAVRERGRAPRVQTVAVHDVAEGRLSISVADPVVDLRDARGGPGGVARHGPAVDAAPAAAREAPHRI